MHLLYLKNGCGIKKVEREIHAKGFVYAAEDCRGHVLVLSQRVRFLQEVIDQECNERCSIASLFESAEGKLKGGRTESFKVYRMQFEEVGSYLKRSKTTFDKVIIAAMVKNKWVLE